MGVNDFCIWLLTDHMKNTSWKANIISKYSNKIVKFQEVN